MARSRNIKPGFFKNEELAECDPLARILFAGLWTIADRDGRLEDRPKRIKAEILPYDNVDADVLLCQLQRFGFIVRYVAAGQGYIAIPTFTKNQQPHVNEAPSTIPPPDDTTIYKEEYPTSTIQVPEQHGTNSPLTESFILETESLGVVAPTPTPIKINSPKKTLAAHPLPAEFTITDAMRQWARNKRVSEFIDLDKYTARFVSYWTEGEGQGRPKKNWLLTWQNWMTDEAEKAEARGSRFGGNNGTQGRVSANQQGGHGSIEIPKAARPTRSFGRRLEGEAS